VAIRTTAARRTTDSNRKVRPKNPRITGKTPVYELSPATWRGRNGTVAARMPDAPPTPPRTITSKMVFISEPRKTGGSVW